MRPENSEEERLLPLDVLDLSLEPEREREKELSRAVKTVAVPIMAEMKSFEILLLMVAPLPTAYAVFYDSL